jgi:hypothetical protein
MRYYLTDYDPTATKRQRARAERLAREALTRRKRRKRPDPLPKGWEPPF